LKEFKTNPMISKCARFALAVALALPMGLLAQTTSNSSPALPAAPSATPTAAAATTADPSLSTGSKVGTINIEQAIYACNEGQRDFEALSKKLEPKQTELKNMNDEVEALKKQLNTGGDKLGEEARAALVKQIEDKQKKLERAVQDARDDAQNQQNEIAQRILQKMAPVITSYAATTGYGLILDTSNPWPQGPVLWTNGAVDITKPVVDAYNIKSGVPAPAKATPPPAKPAGATRPGTTAPASKPQTGTQPPR